jgi:hypothetical protein
MLKKITFKTMVSIIALFVATLALGMGLNTNNSATTTGAIDLIIVDENGNIVFDDSLNYQEGDSFIDILEREFVLICANAQYQADPTCSYVFRMINSEDKVILGIGNDDFNLMTDWSNQFLAFDVYNGERYELATRGPSNLAFSNGDKFRIRVAATNGGLS